MFVGSQFVTVRFNTSTCVSGEPLTWIHCEMLTFEQIVVKGRGGATLGLYRELWKCVLNVNVGQELFRIRIRGLLAGLSYSRRQCRGTGGQSPTSYCRVPGLNHAWSLVNKGKLRQHYVPVIRCSSVRTISPSSRYSFVYQRHCVLVFGICKGISSVINYK